MAATVGMVILAASVVFASQNLTNVTAQSACAADAKSVEGGVEAYKAQTGVYPASVAALTAPGLAPDGVTVVGPWLRSAPSTVRYLIATGGGVVTVNSPAGDPGPLAAPLDIGTVPDACEQATAS